MAEKRKQAEDDNNLAVGSPKKAREDSVTEDEVEEFFAIMRRIHEAVTYFRSADGSGRWMATPGWSRRLRELLEGDGGADVSGVKEKAKRRDEDVEENVGFDLNADPAPECDPL